jgi:hypothetical protein
LVPAQTRCPMPLTMHVAAAPAPMDMAPTNLEVWGIDQVPMIVVSWP